MSEAERLHPDALFVVACPICQGHVAATGSLCGRDACCPLCASLFSVPVPGPEEVAADMSQPAPPALAEDWGPVITQLTPPRSVDKPAEPFDENPLESLEPPLQEPSPATSRPQEPETEAFQFGGTAIDAGAEELVFTEPVRTVRQGDRVIEIRRLSPEERRSRRFRRNLMMIVVGTSILLAIVLLAGF